MPERRSSLTVRVLQFMLLLALLSPLPALIVTLSLVDPSTSNGIATTFGPLVVISMIAAIMLARRMFSPGWGSPPGPSDGDDGGGWGPRRPPSPPDPPRGGIPLPDAEQSRQRVRDHDRPPRRRLRRRPAREPDRAPARTVPLH